jgi:hypothetical protein
VTARYRQQPTAVQLATLGAPPTGPAPFERRIDIQQTEQGAGDAGLVLEPDTGRLRISGLESELVNQTRLLTSDISRLAVTSEVFAGPLSPVAQLPGNTSTLRRLGQPGVSAVAISPQVAINLDQARMGRPVRDVRLHLTGSYTPPPPSVSARLTVAAGTETVDSWPADDRGVIDHWVSVPNDLLQRFTTLAVGLDVAGTTGRCGEFQPLTLTIDGDSDVVTEAASPPIPAGLQSLPQALMPRVQVGIGPDAFADTRRATAIVTGLQRLSALPIGFAVTDLPTAVAAREPAIVIASDGWDDPAITLPIESPREPTPDVMNLEGLGPGGQNVQLSLGRAVRHGSLQAFVNGGRTLLVATSNGDPTRLDELLRWLGSDRRRWSQLDGVAVVAVPGREPITISAQAEPENDSARGSGWAVPARWAAAGPIAAAALGYGAFRWNSRRRSGTIR